MKLKNNRGITLLSLTIYISVFMLILVAMTTISTFFFNNINVGSNKDKYVVEFNKFIMFFVADIKNYNSATVTENQVQFINGPVYKYQNGVIYRNDIEIAKNVLGCIFTLNQYNVNSTTKNIINVDLQIGKNDSNIFNKSIDFTLKYW